jgi:hypothetical protein
MTAGVASKRAGLFGFACGVAKTSGLWRRHRARDLVSGLPRRFVPERAPNVCAVVELRVETDEDHSERLQLVINGGRCTLARLPRTATTTIAIDLEDLAALLEGRAEPTALFMTQRMRVWGDVLLAARLPHFFSG